MSKKLTTVLWQMEAAEAFEMTFVCLHWP